MKRINFQDVVIKNFLSIGNEPVTIQFKPGLHIITGINRDKPDRRNGVGKTSVFESVYFAVFGTTMRDLKKDLIPNNVTGGVCEVVLRFDVVSGDKVDVYQITRTLNPSKLQLMENGRDVTRDSIKNTEEEIHRVLCASSSLFENCVIMTLNNTTPFMAKSKVDKRKFIEGIFNLEVFSKMMSMVRDEYNAHKRVYEIELTKYEEVAKTVDALSKQQTSILTQRTIKQQQLSLRRSQTLQDRDALNAQSPVSTVDVETINNNITKLDAGLQTCEQKITEALKLHNRLSVALSTNVQTLKRINSDMSSCPVCLREVTDDDRHHIKAEHDKLQANITKYSTTVEQCQQKIDNLRKRQQDLQRHIKALQQQHTQHQIAEQKHSNIATQLQQFDAWIIQIDQDIAAISDETTEVDALLEETKQRVESAKALTTSQQQHLSLLDSVKYVVSEEGVKSYIVKKILELFNSIIGNYLRKMDANCVCTFDEYFEEHITNDKKKTVSYFNFSGAESKNIDFACLFTFMDMRRLQGNVSYNISFYDELFDSSLDERGIELVTNILKERVDTNNECVMVISHRKESIQQATGDVIYLEKKNGTTTRLDYDPFTA